MEFSMDWSDKPYMIFRGFEMPKLNFQIISFGRKKAQ